MPFHVLCSCVSVVWLTGTRLGREPVFTQAQTHLGIRSLLLEYGVYAHRCTRPVPGHRCARCTLSLRVTYDKCEAGPAPIIRNPGDNHAPGGISTSRTPKMGVRTPILGVPGALRAPAGGARTPGGGQKLSPPGDGRHLTDFVAN